MFIRLRIYNPNLKKATNVSSHSYASLKAKITGREFVGMHVSYKVGYANRELFENESPTFDIKTKEDEKQFISDLYQSSNADEVAFQLFYWGLKS